MKFIAFILSAYLLLLLYTPCCVQEICEDEIATQHSDQNKEEDNCGNCSPFFSCTSCSTLNVEYQITLDPVLDSDHMNSYHGFIQEYIPQVSFDFWQPPKLANV